MAQIKGGLFAKGGGTSGGAIPTITIEVSQVIDASSIQLTQAQVDILSENNFVNLDMQNITQMPLVKLMQNSNMPTIDFSSGLTEDVSGYTYMQFSVDKSTLVATIGQQVIASGGGS